MKVKAVPSRDGEHLGARISVHWHPARRDRFGIFMCVNWGPEKLARRRPRDLVDGFFGDLVRRLQELRKI